MKRRGFSLVEIVVVIVIISILAAILLPNYLGKGKQDGVAKKIQAPPEAARGVECSSNLRQVRSALQMASMDETPPQTLADLKQYGVTESVSRCPVSKQPYAFNPAQGRVRCTYEAHERF